MIQSNIPNPAHNPLGPDGTLVVVTNLRAFTQPDGRVVLTQKFVDGVHQYTQHWNGRVRVLTQPANRLDNNLDHFAYHLSDLKFELRIFHFTPASLTSAIEDATVVLAGFDFDKTDLAPLCEQLNIPLIYITEYSTRTQLQIMQATRHNPLKRWRGYLWVLQQKLRKNAAISRATALQCNGTPTYNEYANINPNRLLYFDTRVTNDQLTTHEQIDKRRNDHTPLRLLFSGRLIPMKGATHLPYIAHYLLENRTPFQMKIAGDGESLERIQQLIEHYHLTDHVELLGNLNFQTQLLPLAKSWADIFVCPHLQGDPACTYLETYSCGTPIIGYDNEALAGLVKLTDIGWTVQLNNTKQLADQLTHLDQNRETIYRHAHHALDFASQNTFESTFQKRIDHIKSFISQSDDLS